MVVNLCLQVWDGWATDYGLALGIPEGNPLLQFCMESWGVGMTLVSVKCVTCIVLVFLRCVADLSVSQWGLGLIAVSYVLGSFVPWCVLLFR